MGTKRELVERGINIDGLEETTIPATIAQRDWTVFTSTREPYHEGLVREFYASMVPEVFHNCGRVWVQGVQVEITSEGINNFLQTTINPRDAYVDGFPISARFQPSLRLIAAGIRHNENDIWVPGTTELHHAELEPDMALWSVFIKHSLVPSTHRTVLTVENARILYAIMTDVHFDVGYFIFNNILKTGCDTRSLLTFPCLITYFCKVAGIMAAFNEAETEAPPADIGKKAYNSFCTRQGYPNVTTGERYRRRGRRGGATQQDAGQQPPQGGGYYENPPPWGEQIIHQVAEVREEQQRTNQRMDRVIDY